MLQGFRVLLALTYVLQVARAQEECYTSGSIVGAVIGTLIVLALCFVAGYLFWKYYWKRRQGKQLMLVSGDPEAGLSDRQYAFDNPGFLTEDATLPQQKKLSKQTSADVKGIDAKTTNKENKGDPQKVTKPGGKWQAWSPLSALVGGSGKQKDNRRALDDSFVGEPERNVVALRGHDFTGLGFNICGNMRDGIFVRDVLHRGPASESGRIAAGDRITGINISFKHMVFEDALTILSYASPYDVQLEVEKGAPGSAVRETGSGKRSPSVGPADRLCHPFYRSQSIDDLAKMRRSSLSARKAKIKRSTADSPGPVGVVGLPSTGSGRKEDIKMEQTCAASDNPRISRTSVTMPKPERAKKPTIKSDETKANIKTASPPIIDKHTKFGIRVLPPNVGEIKLSGTAESTQNEQNMKIERFNPCPQKDDDMEPTSLDVKLKDKCDDRPETNVEINSSLKQSEDVPDNIPTEIPEEMRLAAMAAQSNRKSLNADKFIAATMPAIIKPEIPAKPDLDFSSGGESTADGSDTPRKNTKRKAPPPPPVVPIKTMSNNDAESDSDDSDLEQHKINLKGAGTKIELNSAQITIHQSPKEEENGDTGDSARNRGRKTASLGDLSRLETEQPMSIPLERAVSLDMADVTAPVANTDSTNTGTGKKRKAPGAPDNDIDKDMEESGDEDMTSPQSHHYIKKEPRLMDAGMSDTFKRRLKKSSDWGTLEEAILVTSDSQTSPMQTSSNVVLISGTEPLSLQSSTITSTNKAPSFITSSDVVSVQVVTSSTQEMPSVSPSPPSSPQSLSQELSSPTRSEPSITDSSSTMELVTSTAEVRSLSVGEENTVPPELPTSPMPVAQTSVREFSLASPNTPPISNFHHSMTYISTASTPTSPQHHVTEIQVLTGGNVSTAPMLTDNAESTTTIRHGTSGGNLLLIPNMSTHLINGPESLEETLSSFTSTHSEMDDEPMSRNDSPARNNVTVMSINTNGSSNHVEHNNNMQTSPPLKATETSENMSKKVETREVLQITPGELDSVMMSHSHYLLSTQSPEPSAGSSSSFEQWVFLDNGTPINGVSHIDGQVNETDNSEIMKTNTTTMMVNLPLRQTVTHIVLESDSKSEKDNKSRLNTSQSDLNA